MKNRLRIPVLAFAATVVLPSLRAAETLINVNGTPNADVIDADWPGPPLRESEDLGERINGRAGNDTIHALGGNDTVTAGDGDDTVLGGDGNDTINGENGKDTLDGEGGDDLITGGGGDDVIHGGGGSDTVDGGTQNDKVYGDPGNDTVKGGNQYDYVDGGEGADTADGGPDDDCVVGRDANDTLIAGHGDDFIVIVGNSANGYEIYDDLLGGQTAADAGTDLLFFASDANADNFHPREGTKGTTTFYYADFEFGQRTNQPVTVDLNDPKIRNIECVATGNGNDTITGTDRAAATAYYTRFQNLGVSLRVHEMIFAHEGNDTIITGQGDDYVDAGGGDDTIVGRSGALYVLLGGGADTLQFQVADLNGPSNTGTKPTFVKDFGTQDKIEILGQLTVANVQFVAKTIDGVASTTVRVNNRVEIDLLNVNSKSAKVEAFSGGVRITGVGGGAVPLSPDNPLESATPRSGSSR